MMCLSIVLYFIFLPFCIGNSTSSECYNRFLRNCCMGFHLVDGACMPICKGGCPKSQICLEPNVCGFLPHNTLLIDHTLCSGWHNKHNYCDKCNPSHIFSNGRCKPYCYQNCKNGFCESPGVCKCNPGYQENRETNSCDPMNLFSPDDCVDESCQNFSSSTTVESFSSDEDSTELTTNIAPNNCQNDCKDGTCIDGLCQKRDSTDVKQDCQNDCQDGICIEGICQKQEGNSTTTPAILDVTSNCPNGCWGGMCYNGICQCKEGLILNEETNDCIMPCENTCQNGVCNQDKRCECNQGYILQNHSGCVPQCDRDCVNSICVAPTHCECLEGDISRFNISSALKCLLTCENGDGENDCSNGTCVAFNKCQCFDGFFLKPDDRFECVASLVDEGELRRNFLLSIWIIVTLTLLIMILFGCFAHRRMRSVGYNVNEMEKLHSTVMFQSHKQQPECVL